MTVAPNIDEQIADLKFNYEVLINELFHLKEFTSLVEYDPCFRNSSESFEHFVKTSGLGLSKPAIDAVEDASASRRVRRRQSRRETIPEASCSEPVEGLIDERFHELECQMTNKKYKRQSPAIRELSAPKKRKAAVKVEAPPKESIKKEEEKIAPPSPPKLHHKSSSIDNEQVSDKGYNSMCYTTSSSEDEAENRRTKRKRPRVNLIVNIPKQTVTNPLHVTKPEFGSLSEFLQSYKSLDEDMSIEEFNKFIEEQRRLFANIRKGLESGVLKYDPATDSIEPITLKDAAGVHAHRPEPITYFYKEQQQYTFQDHLINQGIVMSRAFQETKKARISRIRKITQMIEQHFRHIAGAEERRQKEEEKRLKTMARTAVQAVKRRWVTAEKAYKVLKKDEEDQLKKIQGKEHLSKMLEQSTQLLGAQLKRPNQDDTEKDLNTSASHSDVDQSDSNSDSFTSSDEEDSASGNEDDARLSVEQLQMKYANLDSSPKSEDEESKTEREDSMDAAPVNLLSEKERLELKKDLEDKSLGLLDESDDEDTDSMSEHSSEPDSGEDEQGSEATSESVPKSDDGLASIFNNIEEGESEVESDYASSTSAEEDDAFDSEESADDNSQEDLDHSANVDYEKKPEPQGGQLEPEKDSLTVVDVPIPSLLRGTLRIYQKQGLNWLASLYNNNTNGILADEMGLGKTIQTISLLAYLACEKQNWGPHLIIVPTSVLLNWEMEFKRFAPGFKVLTYYGSPQQRKDKRKGWNRPDAFHICITSYQLVVHDQHSFKRKKWQYMILDEAHNIKNFRSTRWQALLNFNTERRLLLTGTPLQNNLAELWSLLYFLMPQTAVGNNGGIQGFADLEAFQQWFGRPVDKIIQIGEGYAQDEETRKTVTKLHQVLRPYLLRRLKADVEKQMPAKHEHIVYCRLSKRQRFLYDDFMSRAQTKETLASGNFMSIINCLMQLRKVCNHPDLFEVRPILTSLCVEKSVAHDYVYLNNLVSQKLHAMDHEREIDLEVLNLKFTSNDWSLSTHHAASINKSQCVEQFVKEVSKLRAETEEQLKMGASESALNFQDINQFYRTFAAKKTDDMMGRLEHLQYLNNMRCTRKPVYGNNLIKLLSINKPVRQGPLKELCRPLQTRILDNDALIDKFAVITPTVVSLDSRNMALGLNDESEFHSNLREDLKQVLRRTDNPLHKLQTKLAIAFPDKSLLQYDCGKLQKLATLLRDLKDGGHRALIFTQMTKVLDVLEQFLNYHGYLYMRLDGATKIEDRQILTERFNTDNRITAFILSSRSGGLGINLTGADTVIFYDSDWNPAMDKQCQDRCHRIGQTRDVHIYRFVSEHTIESNILKKANQKRQLDNVVIQRGDFTTDYFTKLSVKDLVGAEVPEIEANNRPLLMDADAATKDPRKLEKLLAQAEDADDVKAAKLAMKEVEVDNEDFQEVKNGPQGPKEDDASEEYDPDDEYQGTRHVEEYMIRFIANGWYWE